MSNVIEFKKKVTVADVIEVVEAHIREKGDTSTSSDACSWSLAQRAKSRTAAAASASFDPTSRQRVLLLEVRL